MSSSAAFAVRLALSIVLLVILDYVAGKQAQRSWALAFKVPVVVRYRIFALERVIVIGNGSVAVALYLGGDAQWSKLIYLIYSGVIVALTTLVDGWRQARAQALQAR